MDFPPGTQYKYSNTNTVLLGMVITKVTGLSVGDYFQQNIFDPLGLADTSYPPNGVLPAPYAHGYNKSPEGEILDATLWNPSWGDAAGRIVSNIGDMSTWAAALGRGTLLRPDTQARRVSKGTAAAPGVNYNFAIFDVHSWIGHNGDSPAMRRCWCICPSKMQLVVFANSDIPEMTSAGQIAYDVTSIVTPGNLYRLGPSPPELLGEAGD